MGDTTRTFHVEITFFRTVEVKVEAGDIDERDDEYEWVQEEALLNAFNRDAVIDEDYEFESVKEVTPAKDETA